MVNQPLRGKSGYQFAILATGDSDITDLDVDNFPPTAFFSEVSTQSSTLSDIADSLVKELDIDVFVIDKTPRYDTNTDPTGIKQKLTKYSNGVLATNTGAKAKIFLVEQASLARPAGKGRSDIFQQDGIHLTTNIINVMRDVYPDTQKRLQQAVGHGPVRSNSEQQLGQNQRGGSGP